jgi:bifunctional UDP-N-acetylglucosamine pyrophosphorylase / glucosamine-1-phosphate N-acetyltransferase
VREEIDHLQRERFLEGIQVTAVLQASQKGTGHAAQVGLSQISASAQAVLIVPGDVPLITERVLQPLVAISVEEQAQLLVLSCRHPNPAGFGRIMRGKDGRIDRIIEHKDCSSGQLEIAEINTSVYLCKPQFLRSALKSLRPDNAQAEYYLTDIVDYGVRSELKIGVVVTDDYEATIGANSRYEMSILERKMREKINQRFMEDGVTFEDADTTYIDEGVKIGRDTYIGAGTKIKGKTEIASGVVVEGNCLIADSSIESGSAIKLFCHIEGAVVGRNCQVGPFARLRPGTVLHEQVKVGNFVETKKAELHAGTKANHLTYLGDAEVGAQTNVGAGTITCNYDGVNKFKTTIDGGCFIGSNTAFVAPVHVGAGAYVGAGSTITQDVPAGALAVARAQQRNIEGWAGRNDKKK